MLRHVSMPLLLLVLASAPARAEDFSGFYAGLNAGYAGGRDRSAVADHTAPDSSRTDAGPGLPPSARGAAAALRWSSRRDAGSAAGR